MSAPKPRRSALYVPAVNTRAITKVASLDCDTVIFDLEDAVAPAMKEAARQNLIDFFASTPASSQERVIRINAIDSADFAQDMAVVARCQPHAVLVPKVDSEHCFATLAAAMAAQAPNPQLHLWAMIETPAAVLRLDAIVQAGLQSTPRLECLVVGTNDIAKDTGVFPGDGRAWLLPWLMHIVLVAKHRGLCVLDGVWNDFGDLAGFDMEVQQAVKMAFDGKTLIHPCQVAPANRVFSPSAAAVAAALEIVSAFQRPEHASAGVINLDGKMVERLHLAQAQRLLALHEAAAAQTSTAQ